MSVIRIQITAEQFAAFLKVQKRGTYNMHSPQARMATGLEFDEYATIIKHYDGLTQRFTKIYKEIMKGE